MEMRVKVGEFVSPWLPVEDFEDVEFEARPLYNMVRVRFLNTPQWRPAWTRGVYTYRTEDLLEPGDLVIAGMYRGLAVVEEAEAVTFVPERPFAQKASVADLVDGQVRPGRLPEPDRWAKYKKYSLY